METIKAILRSDKRAKPEYKTFRQLKAGEVGYLHYYYMDTAGKMANVKVTSLKTWKRKPDVEIHCKFGLYEFFTETYANPDTLTNLYEMIFD